MTQALREALERERHVANEWADMAINGLQWLRNIVEDISNPAEALANMESNLKHCREVSDAACVALSAPAVEAPQLTIPCAECCTPGACSMPPRTCYHARMLAQSPKGEGE